MQNKSTEREREGGGGGASECGGLSENSRGTGHMSLLSLQDETPITGRFSSTFEMANSGSHGPSREKKKKKGEGKA